MRKSMTRISINPMTRKDIFYSGSVLALGDNAEDQDNEHSKSQVMALFRSLLGYFILSLQLSSSLIFFACFFLSLFVLSFLHIIFSLSFFSLLPSFPYYLVIYFIRSLTIYRISLTLSLFFSLSLSF